MPLVLLTVDSVDPVMLQGVEYSEDYRIIHLLGGHARSLMIHILISHEFVVSIYKSKILFAQNHGSRPGSLHSVA